ncbi:hypothetical protein Adt_23200 [Abeliophyllum distichum]|uniref:Uncharacterized protein n=1 Tax=Abeliophyllum distichum TaxID=126358 RepID=A0ABD1SA77_9LAMI
MEEVEVHRPTGGGTHIAWQLDVGKYSFGMIAGWIESIPITAEVYNLIMWKDTSDGRFATKFAWQLVLTEHTIQAVYNILEFYYPDDYLFLLLETMARSYPN